MQAPTLEDLVADRTTVREIIVMFGSQALLSMSIDFRNSGKARRQLHVAIVIIVVVALARGVEENPDDVVSLAVGPKEES
jgi:hypothetical protein